RLAFGSCRTSVPHDARHHRSHGVDALRAYALTIADGDPGPLGHVPDLLLLLGDQVYADATTGAMREFIAARRDVTQDPGYELADFTEYAFLYRQAWEQPALRWLFSWLPTLMIFDDHDVRDDWNTSAAWREAMARTSWWHDRIVSGLSSYWVYQHVGNLSVEDRARDEIWAELQRAQERSPDAEVDLTGALAALAERADQDPQSYRWSYTHELGESRLVVVDTRAARRLEPGNRSMLDDAEMAWLDEQLTGDLRHLLVATSLPFLLPMGLHHVEAWDEAIAEGRWGRWFARFGEWLRRLIDLEHWAAFRQSFARLSTMVDEVATGRRGSAPSAVLFLSGDVHHSYITEADRPSGSRVLQLVCSPFRNPLPRAMRVVAAVLSKAAEPVGAALSRAAGLPAPPWSWDTVAGPWFDNNVAVLEIDGAELRAVWLGGRLRGGADQRPELEVVADLELDVPPPGFPRHEPVAHVHPGEPHGPARLLRRSERS
ncbi:alkaline phosphatase D family protein, partial [Georgenia sp. 10Sc9-8]|nr:alkaline phosphatase D family protein [Georgenia halotolerans]